MYQDSANVSTGFQQLRIYSLLDENIGLINKPQILRFYVLVYLYFKIVNFDIP